ncbi:MAG: tRNA pseudouridine(38-40) synthase TruA [Alphaproteobacteria bacterium]
MNRLKLTIEYDGSDYIGWQKQKKGKSIQEEIEKSLSQLFQEKIKVFGAGRTDSGVHAIDQVAHFDVSKININKEKIALAMNHILRKTANKISILKAEEVPMTFDSRFSVKKKTYLYKIFNRQIRSFLIEKRAWFVPKRLNILLMTQASRVLIGKFDFNAFRSISCQSNSSVRSIDNIKIKENINNIEIRVTGKSFLHNQVRIIVGTLVNVGKKVWNEEKVLNILESKERKNAGPTAPAHGLYLEKIEY